MNSLEKEDSLEESFEHIDFPPVRVLPHASFDSDSEPSLRKSAPLNRQQFHGMFDRDGRILNEHELRHAVFAGGIEEDIRKDVWKFLFGMYPFQSTFRERQALTAELHLKYQALRSRWKDILASSCEEGCQNGCAMSQQSSSCGSETSCSSCRLVNLSDDDLSNYNNKQQIECLQLQAKVYAGRQEVKAKELLSSIRVIDKDVPRTDRDHQMFAGENNANLRILRNILITFAAFHAEVNYAQGMNDLVSRFLIVLQCEFAAFWCFRNYMQDLQRDFMEEGMAKKLRLLSSLLQNLDIDLYNYFNHCEVGDLMFCHRWLLLSFKREFPFDEGVKLFEILSSHHLELNSQVTESRMDARRRREFARDEGVSRMAEAPLETEYTFDLFICVAILISNRKRFFECDDPATVFQCVNQVTKLMSVDDVLLKAESLFHCYCDKHVIDCFEVVEDSPVTAK